MDHQQLRCDFCGDPIPAGEEVVFIIKDRGPTPDTVDEMIEDAVYKKSYGVTEEYGYTMDKKHAKMILTDPKTFEAPDASYQIMKGSIE